MKTHITKFLFLVGIAIIITSCCCPKNPSPTGAITRGEAIDLQATYLANQHMFINEALGIPPGSDLEDNTYVDFDLEDFEEFICKLKETARASSYSGLGLRIHFGAELDENGVPRTTIFIIPTFEDPGTGDPNIFPEGDDYNKGNAGNDYPVVP